MLSTHCTAVFVFTTLFQLCQGNNTYKRQCKCACIFTTCTAQLPYVCSKQQCRQSGNLHTHGGRHCCGRVYSHWPIRRDPLVIYVLALAQRSTFTVLCAILLSPFVHGSRILLLSSHTFVLCGLVSLPIIIRFRLSPYHCASKTLLSCFVGNLRKYEWFKSVNFSSELSYFAKAFMKGSVYCGFMEQQILLTIRT